MAVDSKEENVAELFFNEGTKHWHFKEIVKKAEISEDRANYWLKKLIKEGIIKHVKEKEKMPYFIASFESAEYKNKKKLHALTKLYESGFLNYLRSLEKAEAAVIFGSFSRADWYSDSDIDVFIIGDVSFNKEKFGFLLGREVQVHIFKNKEELKKIRSGLVKNVINGYFVKGSVQNFVEVC
jgi:predicted nucleotidyltransferase